VGGSARNFMANFAESVEIDTTVAEALKWSSLVLEKRDNNEYVEINYSTAFPDIYNGYCKFISSKLSYKNNDDSIKNTFNSLFFHRFDGKINFASDVMKAIASAYAGQQENTIKSELKKILFLL
jgi:hypothetical protein